MVKLKTPLTEGQVRKLKLKDDVLISGTIFTARDRAHRFLLDDNTLRNNLSGSVIYHCGPVVKGNKVIAAGPTSSIRLEKYEADVIKKYKIKAIIGKGGMGEKTVSACKKYGCVYLSAVGGAAALLAKSVKNIRNVYKKEFGMEAIFELEVENFPAVVTIDASGKSVHDEILKKSEKIYKEMTQ